MQRWRRILLSVAVSCLTLLGTRPALAASEDEKPGELGLLAGIGLGDEQLVGSSEKNTIAPLLGARFAWHFTPHVSGFIDGTFTQYKGASTLYGNAGEYAFRIGPEWHINTNDPWQFFINVGGGGMIFDTEFGGNDGRGFLSGGLGVRRAWKPGALRIELRLDRTVTSADLSGGRDYTLPKLMAGWTWGVGAPPKDTDGDGVYDKKDKCPDTPHGAIVDAVGCPKDSDGDGVYDGIDKCPDTPKGWPVDATGCPTDTDGDGVVDGLDKCPNTPKGCKVDASGCPTDADGDGVCDGIDQCPNTPKGCRVDAKGCPTDSDGDSVCDGIDQCPGTPAGTKVDAKGCPPPAPPPPPMFVGKKEFTLKGVNFDFGKSDLKPEAKAVLDTVADSLKAYPDVKVEVGGHTDNVGSVKFNQKLSEARAHAVRDYLVSKGVNPANLTWKGYGEGGPIADNKTDEGRAQNRRVELHKIE